MDSRTYYYARVSSPSQNLNRQLDAFKKIGATDRDIITDIASGKDMNRPGYQALKTTILRSGDTLVILSLDRLGRSKEQIKDELKHFKDNQIRVKILDLPTTMIEFPEGQEWVGDMVNNILIEVLGTISQRERLYIRERVKMGVESARQRNVKFGRPSLPKPSNWSEVYNDWRRRKITAEKAMELTGLKRTSFYRLSDEQLVNDVVNYYKEGNNITISTIQRKFWVGFIKAKEVFDKLVADGVIKDA